MSKRLNDSIIRAATDAFGNCNKWEDMKGLAKTVDDNVLKDANSCFQYGILEIYDCQGLGLQLSLDDEST